MGIVLSDKARADLLQIFRYIDERSPNAAIAFIRRIDTNFEKSCSISVHRSGAFQSCSGLRCLVVGLHLIFYTVERDSITVVRVIDGRMDVDKEFQR